MVNRHQPKFPDLGEFQMIQRFLKGGEEGEFPGDSQSNGSWVGPGDDCANLDGWLITTDMSVEGTHFRLDWSSVEEAVEKCVLSNLSDINAMGGIPGFALLSIAMNRTWTEDVRNSVAQAFSECLTKYKVRILGGDTVVGTLGVFSLTVLGRTENDRAPALRSSAKPGEYMYVSGTLGASAAGLWALQNGRPAELPWKEWMKSHVLPRVPLGLGAKLIAEGKLGACIDLSDGLSSELHHIALQSGVKISIKESQIPITTGLEEASAAMKLDVRKFWLDGGEEYQLLFSSAICPSLLVLAMKPFEIHCIGTIGEGSGVVLENLKGMEEMIQPGAWSHL